MVPIWHTTTESCGGTVQSCQVRLPYRIVVPQHDDHVYHRFLGGDPFSFYFCKSLFVCDGPHSQCIGKRCDCKSLHWKFSDKRTCDGEWIAISSILSPNIN